MSLNLSIKVIAQTPDFMVVYKPEGYETLGAEHSLLSQLQTQYPDKSLHPVHRLDKDTSGLQLVALTSQANQILSTAFLNKEIKKKYIAVSEGRPQKKQGQIIGDMQKARNGSWKLARSKDRPAITSFQSYSIAPKLRLYHLQPLTGKTHQLRVALKALSVPILGDQRYGGAQADRMYLHALRLVFSYKGRQHDYMCPPTTGAHFQIDSVQRLIAELTRQDPMTKGPII